jgi:hypothetical protein
VIVIKGKRLGLLTVTPELMAELLNIDGQVLDIFQTEADKKVGSFTVKAASEKYPIVVEGQQIPCLSPNYLIEAGEKLCSYKIVSSELRSLIVGDRNVMSADPIISGPISADHYYITSGDCHSLDRAVKEFKADYKSKGPYKDGTVFWRIKPAFESTEGFVERKDIYKIISRFSIIQNVQT